jgi:type II secretory pathway component PulK
MRRTSKGFVLLDAIVATALLAVLLAVSAVTLASMAQGRRATENRAIALQLAAGAIERACRLPWEQIGRESLDEVTSQSKINDILPTASMNWTVEQTPEDPTGKRIQVEIVMNKSAAPSAPVKLTCWVYKEPGRVP